MSYSNYDVACVWANRSRASAKSRNVFFEDETIYSYGYHWPLGRLVRLDTGDLVPLVNPIPHTVSTNRHQGCVQSAAIHAPGLRRYHLVEPDLWDSVTDNASLGHAKAETWRRAEERLEAERKRRNARARDNREWAARQAVSELESKLDLDFSLEDRISGSFARQLVRVLHPRDRRSYPYRDTWDNEAVEFTSSVLASDPSLLRKPKTLLQLISAREVLCS